MELPTKNICRFDDKKTELPQSEIAIKNSNNGKPINNTVALNCSGSDCVVATTVFDTCYDDSMRRRHKTHRNTCTTFRLSTNHAFTIVDKMLTNSPRPTNNHTCHVNTKTHSAPNSNSRNDHYGSVFGSKSKFKKNLQILFVIIISMAVIDIANAGTCWSKRTQSGKCKQPMERKVTKEKCCANGDDVGFTEKEMNEFEFFFATALGDGTSCSSCIDSCTTAKCGPHKRCVMRSGQPKCVCAPKCKAVNRVKKVNRSNYEQQHHHHQHHQKYNTLAYSRSFRSENDRRKSLSKKSRRQPLDATTAHSIDHHMSDVQILFGTSNGANQTTAKSDRMIAIAPALITNPNGHRFKKRKSDSSISHATHINGKLLATRKLVSNNNNNILNDSNALHHDESFAMNKMQHMHRRHRTNIYSNYGNNITGNDRNHYRHRIGSSNEEDDVGGGGGSGMEDENNSWDDRIRSGFYGHDLPYPPFDVPQYDNDQYHKAVCGTDGKTYKSECQLRKRACRQESTSLSVAYKGQCQTSCKHVQCPTGQHCLEDQNLMPHCVTCSITCPPYDPAVKSTIANPARLVCGADGNTYRNLCEIKRTACMLGRAIPVAYRGACTETANCNNIKCKERQVCLNDLVTNRPRCVSCSFKCPRRKRPQGQQSAHIKLCGMNNKSYNSWCHMMKDSCHTGYFIDVKHNGVCQNQTVGVATKL